MEAAAAAAGREAAPESASSSPKTPGVPGASTPRPPFDGRVVVFMCAPSSTDLDVLPELRAIVRSGIVPESQDLFPCGSVADLQTSLSERRPKILHYGGHGNAMLGAQRGCGVFEGG